MSARSDPILRQNAEISFFFFYRAAEMSFMGHVRVICWPSPIYIQSSIKQEKHIENWKRKKKKTFWLECLGQRSQQLIKHIWR